MSAICVSYVKTTVCVVGQTASAYPFRKALPSTHAFLQQYLELGRHCGLYHVVLPIYLVPTSGVYQDRRVQSRELTI